MIYFTIDSLNLLVDFLKIDILRIYGIQGFYDWKR